MTLSRQERHKARTCSRGGDQSEPNVSVPDTETVTLWRASKGQHWMHAEREWWERERGSSSAAAMGAEFEEFVPASALAAAQAERDDVEEARVTLAEECFVANAELAAARTELDEAKADVDALMFAVDEIARQRDEMTREDIQLREAHQLLRNLVGDVRGMQSDGASPEQMDRALGDALEAYDRAVLSGSPQPEPEEEK